MLELIVSDDLTPSLACPHCGRPYVHCTFPIPDEGPKCPSCGKDFKLPELLPGSAVPAGVSVVDQGGSWSVNVSTRALKGAIVSLAGAVVLSVCTVYNWMNGGGNPFATPADSDAAILQKLGLFTLAGTIGLLGGAAWKLWGRYTVSVNRDAGAAFQGVAGIGGTRKFSLPVINGVSLTKALLTDSRGNTIEQRVVRMEGVNFYMDLGADLPDAQRAFLGLFLMQKRFEWGRQAGVAGGAADRSRDVSTS
jgi:hypothetical protein